MAIATTECLNGELKLNDRVISDPKTPFGGLFGVVEEIRKVGSAYHHGETDCDEVYVDLDIVQYSDERQVELLKELKPQLEKYFIHVETWEELHPHFKDIAFDPFDLLKVDRIMDSTMRMEFLESRENVEHIWKELVEKS